MRFSQRLLLVFVVALSVCQLHRADEAPKKKVSSEEALQRLVQGNRRFVADELATRPTFPDQRARLTRGQQPFAVVLTCSDSRVVPELVFNQQLGDLFVIRVAGNVTDPVVLGSIEYAVEHLHAPLIVVLGHQHCGAVEAALQGGALEGNIGELVKRVHVGTGLPKDKSAEDVAIKNNVAHHTKQLGTQSKVLKEFIGSNRVQVKGAVYSLESGSVEWLKAEGNKP